MDLISRTVEWVVENQDWKHGGYLNVIFVDNAKIAELNHKYVHKNQPTDVLAFDLSDQNKHGLEGEIYISLDRAVEQSKEYKVSFQQELIRLVTHGMLHLFGYRDDSPESKREMNIREEAAIFAMEKTFKLDNSVP